MHVVNNQDRTWASPAAAGPVSARVRLPASKSVTNRALVLAALGDGPAVIANPLRARDTALAVGALRALGSEIKQSRTDWVITPGQPAPGSAVSVDLGTPAP
jgi:5-enolpyruvylshikimate-3-phosphate synthase